MKRLVLVNVSRNQINFFRKNSISYELNVKCLNYLLSAVDCGNNVVEEHFGGESYYRSLQVSSPQECMDSCIDDEMCTAISFMRRVDDIRCLLYRSGGLKLMPDTNSFVWIKSCSKGLLICNGVVIAFTETT